MQARGTTLATQAMPRAKAPHSRATLGTPRQAMPARAMQTGVLRATLRLCACASTRAARAPPNAAMAEATDAKDDAYLASLGYKQELKRDMGFWGSCCQLPRGRRAV